MNSRFVSLTWAWLVAASLLVPTSLSGRTAAASGQSSVSSSGGQAKNGKKKNKSKAKKSASETSDQNSGKSASGKSTKIDVNSASKEDLDALPGIGDAYAQKIIDGRPYKSKSDLVRTGVLPASAYDKVKDQITARKSSASTAETHGEGAESRSEKESPAGPAKAKNESETSSNPAPQSSAPQAAQAPPEKGMVWVNLDSGVYHREGDRWYGKTKHGKYMSESDAEKAGYRQSKTGKSDTSQKEQ